MLLRSLRSGSSGNCIYIAHEQSRILLDCGGQTQQGLDELLEEAAIAPHSLSGIVVTHLHRDHLNIASMRLAQQYSIPVWMHKKNGSHLSDLFKQVYRQGVALNFFTTSPFCVDTLQITPFGLSHDARGITSGFRMHPQHHPEQALAYAADLGEVPPELIESLIDVKVLFLESNHDLQMLWDNPNRPYLHKKRVSGSKGHLSNEQCAHALIEVLNRSAQSPEQIILGHLSADHNSPQLAQDTVGALLEASGHTPSIHTAHRDAMTREYPIEGGDGNQVHGTEQLSLF
jgi:phosphoribosyl 1,2-cyclic phosphodiesterase